MATEIELQLSQAALQATADGPAVTATAVVRNLSAVVDQYTFQLEGVDPAWWQVTPPSVSLFPGDETTVTLQLQLPAGSVAGSHDLLLRAVSGDNPSRVATAPLQLQVAQAGAVSLSLDPAARIGRSGHHTIFLKNRGNAEAHLTLAGADQEESLLYSFEPAIVTLPPFGEAASALEVKPKFRPWRGRPRIHAFTVQAMPELGESPVAEAAGELTYRPPIGPWGLPAGRWSWLLALIPLLLLALLVRSVLNEQSEEQARAAARATATAAAAVATVPPLPVAGAGAGGGGGPAIKSLAANKAGEDLSRAIQVSWDVERGESVKGQLQGTDYGPLAEASRKGEYRLEASGQGGGVADTVQVVALGPPIIKQYVVRTLRQAETETVRLEYEVVGADSVEIEGKKVDPVRGTVDPRDIGQDPTRGYILQALNGVGRVSSIVYFELPPAGTAVPGATDTATPTPTGTPVETDTPLPTATSLPPGATPEPTAVPAATFTPEPVPPTATHTPEPAPPTSTETAVPPSVTPTTPTPQPCAVGSFTVSPQTGVAPFTKQMVSLTWSVSNAGSIAIRWTDGAGAHEYKSKNAADSTAQEVNLQQPGTITFNLFGYSDPSWTEPSCVGPATVEITVTAPPTATPTPTTAPTPTPTPTPTVRIIVIPTVILILPSPTPTPVPVRIQRFSAGPLQCSGTTPMVPITWAVSGGSDARVYVYRVIGGSRTTVVDGSTQLSGSFTDRPPYQSRVQYVLEVRNSAGGVDTSSPQPSTPIFAVCII